MTSNLKNSIQQREEKRQRSGKKKFLLGCKNVNLKEQPKGLQRSESLEDHQEDCEGVTGMVMVEEKLEYGVLKSA